MSFGRRGTLRHSLRLLVAGGLISAGIAGLAPSPAQAITGGNAVTDSSLNFVAKVSYVGGTFCTGTLIRNNWVLTAAHCVGGVTNPGDMTVRVGTNLKDTGGQVRKAIALYSYPGYTGGHNDIALLKLESPVTGIAPISLADPSQSYRWDGQQGGPFTQYDDGVIAGWGKNGAGQLPDRLQFKGASIMPAEPDGVGLKSIPTSGGPCPGDSGGPLMVDISGELFQVGVMKGQNCSTGANYSEVGAGYLQTWILSHL
ncbi:serine protease [Streptomyces asoensis]|uniref:Serine protease n=1 Tax=Streptomyces asoensis TaxID=249586 RepID=A0A6M4WGX8_9ACTN|nr:serine protease [Streptomyces asoensis]QJS99170.1 serine protease [Streptomyces asoensis]